MKVKLVLFGHHAKLLPLGSSGNSTSIDVESGTTVAEILDAFRVPPEQCTYVQLNGARVDLVATLNDGDEVRVLVPLGGG